MFLSIRFLQYCRVTAILTSLAKLWVFASLWKGPAKNISTLENKKRTYYPSNMESMFLKQHAAQRVARIDLRKDISLARARVHECAGRARRHFALMSASKVKGPILWIMPQYQREQINPCGISHILDPSRFIIIKIQRKEDLLWVMEEALRSGAAPFVIADLEYMPALTPVRRLHLAAEAGQQQTGQAPTGLLLTPDQGGAQGVETRWLCNPYAQEHSRSATWQLTRTKSRYDPPKTWILSQDWQKSVEYAA